ncbi:CGNR zinc finger domain-containing protein [Noviherbaspirillum aerium]|uniref:CGNR zinc finger domain-containing protein n=1 Tax=Noviherbaspirillum aerium TaxID=2588497 RepID=UPI00124E7FB1|nr:ABATE domain-containing protein [Noviherbaspirillum aerium]
MADSELQSGPAEPMLLADHLALDLLNTEAGTGGQRIDFWRNGEDVSRWLQRCGIDGGTPEAVDQEALLAAAKDLRATARELIELRKRGEQGDPQRLNSYLALQQSVPVLEWTKDSVRLVRRGLLQSPLHSLGKVAEAVAELLATGEFELVRQCEHPDCVMWFYDRTKSHRRRWCSMALCGNRHKAAEFRKRQQVEK